MQDSVAIYDFAPVIRGSRKALEPDLLPHCFCRLGLILTSGTVCVEIVYSSYWRTPVFPYTFQRHVRGLATVTYFLCWPVDEGVEVCIKEHRIQCYKEIRVKVNVADGNGLLKPEKLPICKIYIFFRLRVRGN